MQQRPLHTNHKYKAMKREHLIDRRKRSPTTGQIIDTKLSIVKTMKNKTKQPRPLIFEAGSKVAGPSDGQLGIHVQQEPLRPDVHRLFDDVEERQPVEGDEKGFSSWTAPGQFDGALLVDGPVQEALAGQHPGVGLFLFTLGVAAQRVARDPDLTFEGGQLQLRPAALRPDDFALRKEIEKQ